jgi:hypothetical protein
MDIIAISLVDMGCLFAILRLNATFEEFLTVRR